MLRDARSALTNVLVIGSGGAGLRAAIAAHDAGCQVLVVGKRLATDAHTVLASGGINAALGTVDPDDEPRWHFADTWSEGYELADPAKVELFVNEAPERIRELDDWGMPFARTADGDLDQRYFGAHRYRRTCYAGDWTGRAMLETLHQQVVERGIPIAERTYVSHLLVHNDTCFGAMAFALDSGDRVVHLADAVVLAGGGHTRLWRRSSSRRSENHGDAMYLALAAGVPLADLELVQFHPTGMTHPEDWAGQLVTEAMRGEGGRLYNADGERFMERYDPDRMELSSRDRVTVANYTEIQEGRGGPNGGVFLDLTHLDQNTLREQVPRMYRQMIEAQMLDLSQRPVEVAPTAHYSMGGVRVEAETGATAVDGLYAAGEITSGLHGANRLGGNSLSETVIFGARAGAAAAARSRGLSVQLRSRAAIEAAHDELDSWVKEGDQVVRLAQRELREILWEHVGVVRDEAGLTTGIERIRELQGILPHLDVRPDAEGYDDLASALDLRGSLVTALATAMAARERRETRGAQQRSDLPDRDDEHQLVNHVVALDADGEPSLSSTPRPPIPDRLVDWAGSEPVDTEGRLLE